MTVDTVVCRLEICVCVALCLHQRKTVFINSYGRCGAVDAAKEVFQSIPDALKDHPGASTI